MSINDLQVLLAADYSGIEVRMLCIASGDKLLTSQFLSGQDIHSLVGVELTGWEYDKVRHDKDVRTAVKGFHFGIIYGLGPENGPIRLQAQGVKITKAQFKQYLVRYFKRYLGVKHFIDKCHRDVEEKHYVETLFGFRRHIGKEDEQRGTFYLNQAVNCVDFETEILTQRGWLKGFDLKKTDLCLTESGWQYPCRISKFPNYKGPVHVWKSKNFSAVSTPEHRWKVFNSDKNIEQILTSAGMPKHESYRVHRTLPEIVLSKEVYSDDFVRLCGWVLTDGFYSTCNMTGVSISQSKPKTKRAIQSLLGRLGVKTGFTKEGCKYWYIGGTLGKRVRTLFPIRCLTNDFISALSRRQANILIDTMMSADGTRDRIVCGDCRNAAMATGKQKAVAFETLCAWAGHATGVKVRTQKKPALIRKTGQWITSRKPYYLVTVFRRTKTHVCKRHETVTNGNGVWCPTFKDDSAWVARREGVTYITKNTPIQGAAHQLVLIAMALLRLYPKRYSFLQRPIMEVHDELVFSVRFGDLMEAEAQLRDLFETGVVEYIRSHFKIDIPIPLKAKTKAGFTRATMINYEDKEMDLPLPIPSLKQFLVDWRKKYHDVASTPLEKLIPE